MSGNTVLVLGAGFSKAAGGPLLKEVLSKEFVEESDADPHALEAMVGLLNQRRDGGQPGFSVEDLFTEIWRLARTSGSIGVAGDRVEADSLLAELTTHLVSICGGVHIRRRSGLWSVYMGYLSWLYNESRSLTFVTFNYDPLLEQLLDDGGLRFHYGYRTGVEFDNLARRRRIEESGAHVQILKLHGSANWGVCRGCTKAGAFDDPVVAFENPYPGQRRKRCPYCGIHYLESGVVPPILGKAGESRHMGPTWGAARKALGRAREIIVIGYSLPQSDIEAVSLMQEVKPPPFRPRITVVCGSHDAPESYSKLFPRFEDRKQSFEEYAVEVLS